MDNDVYQLPVSFAQRGMWLVDQFSPDGTAYIVPCRAPIDGPLDVPALAAALDAVVDRHETLRTTFRTVDGEPMQIIAAADRIAMRYEDLRSRPDPQASADDVAAAMTREPFDLEAGPLLRVRLLHLAADRYELILVTHHIVVDGRSTGLLFAELAAAYEALAAGAEPKLPDLPIQYGDFALWQAEHRADAAAVADEAYWRTTLAGAPQVVALPTDRPRSTGRAGRGATVEFVIEPATAAGLRGIARAAAATMFMTLLAVYATVVSRYAGRDDILVGVPVAGRTRDETQHLIGLFSNTLPLRVRTDDNPAFDALVARVRGITADGLIHQETPFGRIVEVLAPDRVLTYEPLVQVLFAAEEPPVPIVAGPVTFRPAVVGNATSKVDMSLGVSDTGDGMRGRLTYDTDLFDPAFAAQFVDSFLTAARTVVADPRVHVAEMDLLAPWDRARVLDAWGSGPALGPPVDLVTMLTGVLHGDEPAVVAGNTTLSRHRVVQWSGQIAAALAAVGVGPESTVGLCLPRGAVLIPAMLGVWAAGAAYVPLDPGYPGERLRVMAADAGIRVVLTQSSLAGLVRGMVGTGVTVVRVDAPDVRTAVPAEPVAVPAEALAYTIFTSGSTGRPKGVAVPRGAVAALLRAFAGGIGFTATDTLVAVTTLSFDIAVLELLLPLVAGGRVVIADAAVAVDGVALRRLLTTSAATALQATPATWRMLAAAGGVPPAVRLRLCGGEAVPPDLVDLLTDDRAVAWNVYGPTETTVWSAAGRIRPSPAPIEVGPPIAGTRLLVLDGALRLVPPGVVGEVYIAGAGMARGYHGRAGLTADRFLPDPYAAEPGARMYRTGDLARWRTSGRLDMLGRVDHQVKVRGFRIETGEIEAILDRHESVAHAVVTAYTPPGAAQTAHLVAYVVPAAAPIEVTVLRRHLQSYLPDYMIPSAFVTLAELPLTLNGKVDRAGLPQPQWGEDAAARYAPATTPVQQRLVDVWTELLPGAERIGIHDNFFTLGGHSLVAMQLVARIQTEYGVKLALRALFTHPTVSDLAAFIEGMLGDSPASSSTEGDAVAQAARELGDIDMDDLLGSLGSW